MKHFYVAIAAIITIIFLGCSSAPSTRFLVERAPEIIIPDAKTLQIKTFDISSDTYRSSLRDIHKANLQSALFSNNTFKVVSNGKADFILGGTLNFIVSGGDPVRNESTDKEGNKSYSYSASRKGELQVHLIVTDSAGEMLGTSKFNIIKSSSVSKSKSWSEARKGIKTKYELFSLALDSSVQDIVRRITPYTETVKRTFAEAEDKKIEKANEHAENGNWEAAYQGWVSAEQGNVDSKVASYYNQSIYFEKKGDLRKASELIEKAINIKPENKFISRQSLLSQLMAEKRTLNKHFAN